MLHITSKHGFHLQFENGWTVSVQWGPYNYCENYFMRYTLDGKDVPSEESYPDSYQSKDAEIAAWDSSGEWFDFGDDTVKGWVSADEVADFIHKVRNFK